jgi:hypothetical protein
MVPLVRRVFATLAAASALVTGLVVGASAPAAWAVQAAQPAVVSSLAVGYTPAVNNGVV